jgi:hypothetical protein
MSWMPEGAATRAFHDAYPDDCVSDLLLLHRCRHADRAALGAEGSAVAVALDGRVTVETFAKIQFPAALPHIFAGLKVASTLAVVGAVVGEFVAADRGLGYQLIVANGIIDVQSSFAVLVTLTLTVCASVSRSAAHWFTMPASC